MKSPVCLIVSVFVLVVGALSPLVRAQGDLERPVVVAAGMSDNQMEDVKRVAPPQVKLIIAKQDDLVHQVAEADALIGSCAADAIRAGKKLRWVHSNSAGIERCMHPELVNSDITLTNARIIQGPEIADHAFALLLYLTRNIDKAAANKPRQDWNTGDFDPIELQGKTALIIGLGGIGTQIAQRAFAFGMRVLAIDPKDIPFMRPVEKVGKPDQLHDFLPEADVVFMSAPHTPKSERMMGAKEFSLMKRGAYYISVSRGMTTDTQALVQALRSRHLKAAGLDVMDPEPLPKGHPLWTLDNVILTPHVATRSDRVWERRLQLIEDNLNRFVQGLPLRHVVDKSKGY